MSIADYKSAAITIKIAHPSRARRKLYDELLGIFVQDCIVGFESHFGNEVKARATILFDLQVLFV